MRRYLYINSILALTLASTLFVGCGSSSGSGDTPSQDTNIKTSGVLVDPYIVGSVLCEDVNKDGLCGSGEQLSSATNENGVFEFDQNLTAGSHVIIKTQGIHEGKTYDLDISGVVASDGSIDVVSPLTTFEAKGLSTAQIAEILNNAAADAGLTGWNITAADISSNPLSGGLADKTISSLSDSDLVTIQASLASYGILKIMKGSEALSALSGEELYSSGMQLNGHEELYLITKAVIGGIVSVLNKSTLTSIKSSIDTGKAMMTGAGMPSTIANAGLPEPTTALVIKIAVSIIDRLAGIGYSKCNETHGDVAAALAEVSNNETVITNKAIALGTQFYAFTYHNQMKTSFTGMYAAGLSGILADSNMAAGYNAKENGYTTIRFDSSNNIVAE